MDDPSQLSDIEIKKVTELRLIAAEAYYRTWQHESASSLLKLVKEQSCKEAIKDPCCAKANYLSAWIALRDEDFPTAMSFLQAALNWTREHDHKLIAEINLAEATILHYMGKSEEGQAKNLQAKKQAEKMDPATETIDRLKTLSKIDQNIAIHYHLKGDLEKALENYLKSIDSDKEIGYSYMLASKLNNIGYIHQSRKSYDRAITYYKRSLKNNKKSNDLKLKWTTYENLGEIARLQGRFDDAKHYLSKSIEAAKAIDYKSGMAHSLSTLGAIFIEEGQSDAALTYLGQASAILKITGRKLTVVTNYLRSGKAYETLGQSSKAIKAYSDAYDVAKESKMKIFLKESLENLSRYHKELGHTEISLKYFEELYDLSRELQESNQAKTIAEMDQKYETAIKNQKIELLEKENELVRLSKENEHAKFGITASILGAVIIVLLLTIGRFRQKTKAHRIILKKNEALAEAHVEITRSHDATAKAEEKVRQQYLELSGMLHSMQQAVFTIGPDLVVQDPVSDFSELLFGFEVVGKNVMNFLFNRLGLTDEELASIRNILSSSFGEEMFQWDLNHTKLPQQVNYTTPEETLAIQIRYTPILDKDEQIIEIIFVVDDQTDLIKAKHQLNSQQEVWQSQQEIMQNFIKLGTAEVIAFLNEFIEKTKDTLPLIIGNPGDDKRLSLLVDLHRLKGNARLLGLKDISTMIHSCEGLLQDARGVGPETFFALMKLMTPVLRDYDDVGKAMFSRKSNLQNWLYTMFKEALFKLSEMKVWSSSSNFDQLCIESLRYMAKESKLDGMQSLIEAFMKQPKEPIDAFIRSLRGQAEDLVIPSNDEHHEVSFVVRNIALLTQSVRQDIKEPLLLEKLLKQLASLTSPPLEESITRLQTMADDIAGELNKEVSISQRIEHLIIPSQVARDIMDIVTQSVRNSLDHGIEPMELRKANQKDPRGQIHIAISIQSEDILIEYSDDGGGIDKEKIELRAAELGMSLKGIDNPIHLIFEPEFSTQKDINDISGRGLGMSIIKEKTDYYGGDIQIQTELGKGVTFKIRLPNIYQRPSFDQVS